MIGECDLDYAELHRRIHQIAGWLRGAGLGPDDVVGVLLPRGSALLVTLLGVLASGAAYTPLDPCTPPLRLASLAGSARLRWVITDRAGLALAAALPDVIVLDLAASCSERGEPIQADAHPDDLAYVVFTSGSTGEPKPVAIPRHALDNHAAAIAARYRLGAGDSFAAGLIHGLLDGDLQKGLDYGVAVSAIKHSIPGDFAWVTRDEVEAILKGGGLRISR